VDGWAVVCMAQGVVHWTVAVHALARHCHAAWMD